MFVDADWYDLSAHSRQTSSFSQTIPNPGAFPNIAQVNGSHINLNSKTTVDALISPEWSISVGGRVGWLATPRTLLYVLGAYTHADLDDARVKVSITDPLRNFQLGGFNVLDGNPFGNNPTNFLMKLPDSIDGFSLGGGGEVKLRGPWALRLEYRWTHFDGGSGRASSGNFDSLPVSEVMNCESNGSTQCWTPADFRDTKSQASADFDLDLHTVRAALTYHFWSGGGYGG